MTGILLSVFAPELPTLPLSNPSRIQSSPFAGIALNLPTPSGGDSYSSGRNNSTTSTGNRNRGRIDRERAERMSASSRPFVITKQSHEGRKSDLGKALEPMLGDGISASALLCWGEKHRCHITPVNIANSMDEVAVWREIQRAWYTYRGHWRRYLPFFGVSQVDIVKLNSKVSIAGLRSEGNMQPVFVGMYTEEDLGAERRQLEEVITNYQPQDYPCKYNLSTDDAECPEEKYHEAQRRLSLLDTRSLLTLFFSDARLAALNGLLNREGLVYSHLSLIKRTQ
ncbi:uncharacterized protein P174DRAFT_435409 [Aspergillus novofumigatus IBT 16806]|uniref:Uncharacterized protein n=1 Tax=Aspergillus novofumigatus (strain IBT 16806) TaxID=1392255 RepID=A0A2I1BVA2_ASPN1|nr:uncharacterized protein P174DRAFT_435409 [Aspergillus novofumigatus IBT 16806]PKX89302.1 hypothetical protein P174DRAFT_435409 [Aspergillus novofumigatus IBT 16806]